MDYYSWTLIVYQSSLLCHSDRPVLHNSILTLSIYPPSFNLQELEESVEDLQADKSAIDEITKLRADKAALEKRVDELETLYVPPPHPLTNSPLYHLTLLAQLIFPPTRF